MSTLRPVLGKNPSKKVESFEQIEPYIAPMQELLKRIRLYNKGAVALHHAQVKDAENLNFFVLSDHILFDKYDKYPVFCNAKILEKDPASAQTMMEGCLSFPTRPNKKMKRYNAVFVQFTKPITDPNDPRKIIMHEFTQWFTGLMAQIMQHEIEHGQGRHIF